MSLLKKFRRHQAGFHARDNPPEDDGRLIEIEDADQVGYNPQRDEYLYWRTKEGYILAQDVNCQHEYVRETPCEACGGELIVMAHLNRGGQGLSELVAVCQDCRQRANFIFDISNEVYQAWWASQLGNLYLRQHDIPPRVPFRPE